MRILVPGNLLLFGEYAVTYPKGLGIAVATQEKLSVETKPADQLTISGIYGDTEYYWTVGDPFPNKLLEHIVTTLKRFPKLHLHIDSSEFYHPDGSKKGFGSSAATTIGLAYALMHKEIHTEDELINLTLDLHRSFQGGRGSGYDIVTSCKGGAGLFQGGQTPYWKPLNPFLYRGMYLIRGKSSCNTRSTLDQLKKFETQSPERIQQFIKVSNQLVSSLSQSMHCFSRSIVVNHWINHSLSQEIPWDPKTIKPLGAGGEIGASFSKLDGSELLRINPRGVQCQL